MKTVVSKCNYIGMQQSAGNLMVEYEPINGICKFFNVSAKRAGGRVS